MTRVLLLLDVDGVLVHPVGYKAALRDTVDAFAVEMGLPQPGLTEDEIAVFEACGITNEWDSGAISVTLLLLDALTRQPALRRDTLADTFAALRAASSRTASVRPDFAAAAREVLAHTTDGLVPARVFHDRLAGRVAPDLLPLLETLLGDVYSIDAPVTRHFQHRTLGSDRFPRVYGQPAAFDSPSYLIAHDRPLLSDANRDRLKRWHRTPHRGAAIFTARPSLPPVDVPDPAPGGCPPEGDLAAELIGLDGALPLIGQGRIAWLAARYQRHPNDFVKPSPIQALAAIGAAAADVEGPALEAAAALFEGNHLTGPLADLRDAPTEVVVFEDSTGGIRATRRAVEVLQAAGVGVTVTAIGVSPQADKRVALGEIADHVVDDINAGLALLPGWLSAS